MALHHNPRIVTSGLRILIDVADSSCNSERSAGTVPTDHFLYNLADRDYIEYLYNDENTETQQQFVSINGNLALYHEAWNGSTVSRTTWRANTSSPRHDNYTFICWYKFDNVGQSSENIYGGGFDQRTNFYMSPGGNSESDGVLAYSDGGSTDNFSMNPGGGNDGQWHMRAFTMTGPDIGTQTLRYYRDANLIATQNSAATHDNPDGNGLIRWGSWAGGYGNMTGYLNGFMYYDRLLTQEELLQNYLATKTRYQ